MQKGEREKMGSFGKTGKAGRAGVGAPSCTRLWGDRRAESRLEIGAPGCNCLSLLCLSAANRKGEFKTGEEGEVGLGKRVPFSRVAVWP